MKRLMALGVIIGLTGLVATSPAAPTEKSKNKAALQELHEFVGGWKGTGGPKLKPGPRDPFWSETVQWGWRFKGDDCWMTMAFQGGKFLKTAELRFLPDKKKYELVGTTPDGKKKLTFLGTFKDDALTFTRTDADTSDTQRIRVNLAGDGIRLIYQVDRQAEGGTIWKPEFAVQTTKIGESLAKTEKGPECVVSGGRGTTAVAFGGETFYVCCSGCADAFRESPKKYVDEFKAKKGKKK